MSVNALDFFLLFAVPVHHWPSKDLDEDDHNVLPWIVSGVSVCGMMLCTGLACGALCHARLSQGSARSPALLTTEESQSCTADVEEQVAMNDAE